MKLYNLLKHIISLIGALTLAAFICTNQIVTAQSGLPYKGSPGAYNGPPALTTATGAAAASSGSSSSAVGVASSNDVGNQQQTAAATSTSASNIGGASSSSGSTTATTTSAESSGTGTSSASTTTTSNVETTTKAPESGLFEKVKEIFKESKEKLKNKVEEKIDLLSGSSPSTTSSASSASSATSANSATSATSANSATSATSANSANSTTSATSATSANSATSTTLSSSSPSYSSGSSSGLIDKLSNVAKKGKEAIKENIIEPIKEKKEKTEETLNDTIQRGKGAVEKVENMVSKGADAFKDTVHKIEDKAHDVETKIRKASDENIIKPMQSVSGSGIKPQEGRLLSSASASSSSSATGSERMKLLEQAKSEQETYIDRPTSLKTIIGQAKGKGVIPQNEDRSVLKGNHPDESSVAVEVYDKAHEISKIPAETLLKPIDKVLGYEKDPLLRMYDNSHEALRTGLNAVAKPVESIAIGAFKTSDESKRENEKLLATASAQERLEAQAKAEKAKIDDRSVLGNILDKHFELKKKPLEIVLRPLDHLLGFDKKGKKKNPLLQIIEEIYGFSKKPIDAMAKPVESILKKMGGDNGMNYQVSIRFNPEDSDPKLITRIVDGTINIAERVVTKPLEFIMKPLNHVINYDDPGKKNPIVEAAHSFKNATKIGAELFTKPVDRIIKEISNLGANLSEAEREACWRRQQEEASRLVQVLDKLHQVLQKPFEVVLRPVSKVLGITNDGSKEPILATWDVLYQVQRTPVQIISKPIEEAFLGNTPKRLLKPTTNLGNPQIKRNHFVENIKTAEKFVLKPIGIITSPIRRLILGDDNEKSGTATDKNNREIQSKAQASSSTNASSAQAQSIVSTQTTRTSDQPDKIIKTLEKMNNLALRPLELITQPLSDLIWGDENAGSKKVATSQTQTQTSQSQTQAGASASASQAQSQSQASVSGGQAQSQSQAQAKSGQSQSQSQVSHSRSRAQAQVGENGSQALAQAKSGQSQSQSQSSSQSQGSHMRSRARAQVGENDSQALGQVESAQSQSMTQGSHAQSKAQVGESQAQAQS